MSLPSTTSADTPGAQREPQSARGGQGRGWRIFWLLAGLALLVALASLVGQWWNSRQNSMIPGRPLSYPQTHLHTVTMSTRAGVVYLGTHVGLFTSTDGGHTWPQNQGALNTCMVTAIAVSPDQPDKLAVLTVPTSGLGRQPEVYVSSDAGQHWRTSSPAGLSATAYPYTIQSAPGAGGHFYVFYSYAGWFETRDLGLHWQPITSGSLSTILSPSLLVDASNPAHLLMGGDLGLFETRDDGQSWQKIKEVSGSVLTLAATTAAHGSPRTVLVSTDQGLYRWRETPNGPRTISRLSTLPAAASATRMAVSADGRSLYALFGSDLWFSSDLGTHWTQRWHFTRGDLVSLVLAPDNQQELLAGFYSPAVVQFSTDAGRSWQVLTH
jgi:photosystem II stability/assembly factor-like uncharacterized protein